MKIASAVRLVVVDFDAIYNLVIPKVIPEEDSSKRDKDCCRCERERLPQPTRISWWQRLRVECWKYVWARSRRRKGQEVKDFGAMTVADHGKAGEDLKAVTAKHGVTLPTDLDAKHKAIVG